MVVRGPARGVVPQRARPPLDSLERATKLPEIGWALLRAESDDDPPPNSDERDPFRDELVRRMRLQLLDNATRPVSGVAESGAPGKVWAELETDAAVREWLGAASLTPPWTVEDVTTLLVERRSLVGRDEWHPAHSDEGTADKLLGLDLILDHFELRLDGGFIDWNGSAPKRTRNDSGVFMPPWSGSPSDNATRQTTGTEILGR